MHDYVRTSEVSDNRRESQHDEDEELVVVFLAAHLIDPPQFSHLNLLLNIVDMSDTSADAAEETSTR